MQGALTPPAVASPCRRARRLGRSTWAATFRRLQPVLLVRLVRLATSGEGLPQKRQTRSNDRNHKREITSVSLFNRCVPLFTSRVCLKRSGTVPCPSWCPWMQPRQSTGTNHRWSTGQPNEQNFESRETGHSNRNVGKKSLRFRAGTCELGRSFNNTAL